MAEKDKTQPQTQLATRIPADLHYRCRLHCVNNDVTLMALVASALEAYLANAEKGAEKPKAKKA